MGAQQLVTQLNLLATMGNAQAMQQLLAGESTRRRPHSHRVDGVHSCTTHWTRPLPAFCLGWARVQCVAMCGNVHASRHNRIDLLFGHTRSLLQSQASMIPLCWTALCARRQHWAATPS